MTMLNKIGPHHGLGGSDTQKWMELSHPTVAKFVGDLGGGYNAPASILTIGRVVDDGMIDGQGFDANRYTLQGLNAYGMALRYFNEVLREKIERNPWIKAWSGPNEQVITDMRAMTWYGSFCYGLARLIHSVGKRPVIGGWATGTPEFNLWPYFATALRACKDYNAILDRHEYGPLDGYLSLRYRKDNDAFAAMGYPNLPVVISECGGDNVPGSGPWKKFYGTMERYWNEYLLPYNIALNQDAYCLGATLFTSGGGWVDYDVTGTDLVDRLARFEQMPTTPLVTHRVTASLLNVRQFPWVGARIPPIQRQIKSGTSVRVIGTYKPENLAVGWGCLSPDGDEWVSLKYLQAL